MNGRRGSVTASAALLGALLLLTASGCTAPEGDPVASSPPPPSASPAAVDVPEHVVVDGLALSILQNRPDYATRTLQLSIGNEGDAPLTVVSAHFESTQFATAVDYPGPVEVPAGLVRQLPVPLGASVCPAPADPTPMLTVGVTDATGAERTVAATPADPFGVLPRIAQEDCFEHEVSAIAALRLDDRLRIEGSGPDGVARLTLHVEPAARPTASGSPASLTLDGAASTILLEPAAPATDADAAPADGGGAGWPLGISVARGHGPTSITLDAVPARCDPHAIAEDKRGTVLPVAVTLADGTEGTVHVSPSDELRLALYAFIASTCGFAVP
ncbi:hypothetical protein N1028_17625 [Herbiconiux sp. CPCC 203407]|uniref:DUF4232 domain-containing protein n=1 Tax=Herbiconiux oxytropis TaxID=2970915 RepID=A0AA42BWZ8_9MICO|nr:hypothetical protein [Herbiconiux oxytropis]MCS5724237.1 hypothetical protein [Herbiconiux oxytropis]MCS5727718.1 hypothetical protein [Herbiconiux oxytropis]